MTTYKGYEIEIEHIPNGEQIASYLNSKHQAKCSITRLIKKEKQG